MKPEKIPVHPKLVPTNADLKRSNMLDRYAGIRDPTFKATWDLSEIAKGSDKGKAGSIFSFSTAKTKKTYDVAVKNPIIAAKEAEDASKGGAGHGGGFGGLFRRSSRASHQDGPAAKPVLIDDKRDPKEIFAEAERMAAWEAQEKERKEAERAEERERQRIANEMAKQERKRKDAEAKEQRRQEREERKRQSKLTVNTANAGPPPRYSQAGAQQAGVASQISPEAASSGDESSPDIEKQHSEGHRLGDEVPGGAGDRPHDSNFNEEFSVLDHSTVGREHGAEDDVASGGSSITEEAPRTVQDENTQAVAAAEGILATLISLSALIANGHSQMNRKNSMSKAARLIGTLALRLLWMPLLRLILSKLLLLQAEQLRQPLDQFNTSPNLLAPQSLSQIKLLSESLSEQALFPQHEHPQLLERRAVLLPLLPHPAARTAVAVAAVSKVSSDDCREQSRIRAIKATVARKKQPLLPRALQPLQRLLKRMKRRSLLSLSDTKSSLC